MNWIESILNSDAGRGSPELARELVRAAGGQILQNPAPLDEVEAEVLKGEFS